MSEIIRQIASGRGGPIRAYHGSPHNFDQFDASKIGTGEGAQAFGHGLYFAESEGTARHYRDKLAPAHEPELIVGGKPIDGGGILGRDEVFGAPDGSGRLPTDAERNLHPRDQAIRLVKMAAWGGDDIPIPDAFDTARSLAWEPAINKGAPPPLREQEIIKELNKLQQQGAALNWPRAGHMYEVDIDVNPDSLLYGDRPVSSQVPTVVKALKDLGYRTTHGRGERDGLYAYNNLVNKASREFETKGAISRDPKSAERLARDFVTMGLLDSGVPGISYLDHASRRKGYGSSNYVIFPGAEGNIRILRKFGLLAPVAAGAAAGGSDE